MLSDPVRSDAQISRVFGVKMPLAATRGCFVCVGIVFTNVIFVGRNTWIEMDYVNTCLTLASESQMSVHAVSVNGLCPLMVFPPVGFMDQVVLGLTFLILLRFTRQSLPPLLSAWRQYDVQYLDHLHEVMSPPCSAFEEARSYDVGLQAVQAIMANVHDFATLRRAVPVLRDQWHRFLRSNPCPGPAVSAALRTLVARGRRTQITSFCVHVAGVQQW